MRSILRLTMVLLGLACFGAAGFLFWETQSAETQAQNQSASIAQSIQQSIVAQPSISQEVAQEPAQNQVPSVEIQGTSYMGVLSIPQLGLELPISSAYGDAQLQGTPCVYTGTQAQGDLVIAAHNFKAHFGNIDTLCPGDAITLLDVAGTLHTYTVTGQEVIDGNDVEGLYAGTWDLTLFTCLYRDNRQRVVVRFDAMVPLG